VPINLNINYFPAGAHNRLVVSNWTFLNKRNLGVKSLSFNWLAARCRNKMQISKNFAGHQNQAYRSVMKTLLRVTEVANMMPVKACAPWWTFSCINAN